MTQTAKFLSFLLVGGIVVSSLQLFKSSTGGGALEDCIRGLVYTSILLFFGSLTILIYHRKELRERKDEIVLFFVSIPATFFFFFEKINRAL